MSDTVTSTGWTIAEKGGDIFSLSHATLGTLVVKVMDPADTLDLMEAAGSAAGNEGYMRLAMVVCSVTEIDGRPIPRPNTKDKVKQLARELGNEKVAAVVSCLFGAPAQANAEDEKTAAKN